MEDRKQLLNGDLVTITKDRAIENADHYDQTKYTNDMIITKMNQNIETISNKIEEWSMKGRYDMTVDMPLDDATAIYTLDNHEIPIIDELFKVRDPQILVCTARLLKVSLMEGEKEKELGTLIIDAARAFGAESKKRKKELFNILKAANECKEA